MDAPYNLPDLCRETGLSCTDCTDGSARNVARLCKGLQQSGVSQLFVNLYPHQACAPMVGHFQKAYTAACHDFDSVPRRPAGVSAFA